MKSPPRLHRLAWLCLLGALVACVLGARWGVVYRFGSDIPEWDQWDAEGVHCFAAAQRGEGLAAALWTPHNEHRVVLTKLWSLGILSLNGQWDQRLEAVCNAFLAALLAGAMLAWSRRRLPAPALPAFTLLAACCWGLPLAWQNVMGGFHSQQFFLLLCAFATLSLLPGSRPGSGRWLLGLLSSLLGLLSMGSGPVAPGLVSGFLILRALRDREGLRREAPTILACIAVAGLGLALRVPFPAHDSLHAQSLQDVFLTLAKALRWPSPLGLWSALPLWLPSAWLAVHWLRSKGADEEDNTRLVLLSLSAWTFLQCVATALMRGAGAPDPASRYIDTLVFGSLANALALAWLLGRCSGPKRFIPAVLAALAWSALLGWGLLHSAEDILRHELPNLPPYYRSAEQNVRSYLASGDASELNKERIPYPNAAVLKERLDMPELRPLLPASIRPPLFIAEASESFLCSPSGTQAVPGLPEGFPRLGLENTPGSFGREGAATLGSWTSAPLRARQAWLRFEVAGKLGSPGLSLELRDPESQTLLAKVVPDDPQAEAWRPVFVRNPGRPFLITANDQSRGAWFAFSAPREQATGSQAALLAGQRAPWLVVLGLGLFLVGTLLWTIAEASPSVQRIPE